MFSSYEYSFADITVKMLGIVLRGCRGITYKVSQDKEAIYGAGNQPLRIQRGLKKYEGTLMLLKSDYDTLEAAAIAAGYESLLDVPGELVVITVVYQQPNSLINTTMNLFSVEFTEVEDGQKSGDKFKEISLPFMFLRMAAA